MATVETNFNVLQQISVLKVYTTLWLVDSDGLPIGSSCQSKQVPAHTPQEMDFSYKEKNHHEDRTISSRPSLNVDGSKRCLSVFV